MANPITQIILTAVDKTRAAFASAKAGLSSLGAAAGGLRTQLGLIFTGLSVVGFVGQIKRVVDAMDEANKSAQKIGTSVENFSGLSFAASQAGVPVEELEKGLLRLARTLDEAKSGTGKAAEAFQRLNIDPRQFNDPADALLVIAERFAALPDGVTKAALAQEMFGRSGANMIPMLNQGAEGIRALVDEARQLGAVFDGEAAAAAESFNDNMDKLRTAGRGLGVAIAQDILPGLEKVTAAMTTAAKDGGLLNAAWVGLGGLGAALFTDEFKSTADKLAEARAQLARATSGFFTDEGAAARLRERIAALEDEAAAEKRAADAKRQASEASSKAAEASRAAQEVRDEEVRGFKESVNEQVKDAERLGDALRTAFSASINAEEDYLRQAKKLRAEASGQAVGDDVESQASATLDATIAAMRLQREAGTANLETVQAQAEALRQMADKLADVTKAEDFRRQANLAEATALERAAADERARYQGLAEQQRLAAAEAERLQDALEGIGKGTTVDIKPGPGIEQTKQDLAEILRMLDQIGDKPLAVGTSISGTPGQIAESLRTAALQYGRR